LKRPPLGAFCPASCAPRKPGFFFCFCLFFFFFFCLFFFLFFSHWPAVGPKTWGATVFPPVRFNAIPWGSQPAAGRVCFCFFSKKRPQKSGPPRPPKKPPREMPPPPPRPGAPRAGCQAGRQKNRGEKVEGLVGARVFSPVPDQTPRLPRPKSPVARKNPGKKRPFFVFLPPRPMPLVL